MQLLTITVALIHVNYSSDSFANFLTLSSTARRLISQINDLALKSELSYFFYKLKEKVVAKVDSSITFNFQKCLTISSRLKLK